MSERVRWLDGWRGLVCWLMVGYHLFFDLIMFGWVPESATQWPPVFAMQRFIALSFIFLAGASARFTHSNLRRGFVTLVAGCLVQAAAELVGAPIRFGILQFLACAMFFWHFLGRYVERLPERFAPWLWAGLYLVTRVISYTTLVGPGWGWLYPLGLRARGFLSYDWVPFIPNIFMFFLGAWFGERILTAPADSRLRTAGAPEALAWTGRRTLLIYLVHQPVLYGLCWIVCRISA